MGQIGLKQRSYLYQGTIRAQGIGSTCSERAAGQNENTGHKGVVSSGCFCFSDSRDSHTYPPHPKVVFPDCLAFLFSWPSTGMWFREQQRGRLLCCRSLVVVSAIAFQVLIIWKYNLSASIWIFTLIAWVFSEYSYYLYPYSLFAASLDGVTK